MSTLHGKRHLARWIGIRFCQIHEPENSWETHKKRFWRTYVVPFIFKQPFCPMLLQEGLLPKTGSKLIMSMTHRIPEYSKAISKSWARPVLFSVCCSRFSGIADPSTWCRSQTITIEFQRRQAKELQKYFKDTKDLREMENRKWDSYPPLQMSGGCRQATHCKSFKWNQLAHPDCNSVYGSRSSSVNLELTTR